MPTRAYPIEDGGEKRLELSWERGYRDLVVRYDGAEVGREPGGVAVLRGGKRFTLPDGNKLDVFHTSASGGSGLQLLVNGRHIPGSVGGPLFKLRNASWALYILGGINIVFGVVLTVVLANSDMGEVLGFSWVTVALGALLIVLGYFVSKRSMLALVVGAGIILVDTGLLVYNLLQLGGGIRPANISGLVLRAVFLVFVFQGFGALNELQQSQKTNTP
jgi:hypothetical protein